MNPHRKSFSRSASVSRYSDRKELKAVQLFGVHYYFRRLHRVEKLAEQGETLPDQKAKTHICVYIEGFYNNSPPLVFGLPQLQRVPAFLLSES